MTNTKKEENQIIQVLKELASGKCNVTSLCNKYQIDRGTLYYYIKKAGIKNYKKGKYGGGFLWEEINVALRGKGIVIFSDGKKYEIVEELEAESNSDGTFNQRLKLK
jgi:hypothetical protein